MSIQTQQATNHAALADAQTLRVVPDPLQTIIMDIKGEDGRVKKELYTWGPLLGKVRSLQDLQKAFKFFPPLRRLYLSRLFASF